MRRAPFARRAGVCRFFFFSSRRRHTRWPRDWSSDVCSSDLEELLRRTPSRLGRVLFTSTGTEAVEAALKLGRAATKRPRVLSARSEERRVGKEGKYRRVHDHQKEKRGQQESRSLSWQELIEL